MEYLKENEKICRFLVGFVKGGQKDCLTGNFFEFQTI